MLEPNQLQESRFFAAFLRPAWVIMMVAQMVLGLALAITLIVKFYMLVFGTDVCSADSETLGNMIRCTPTLEIVAHFVLGVAGFRFAAFMFVDRPRALLGPLMIGFAGVLLLFLSGLSREAATWPIAATIVVLVGSMSAIVAGQYFLGSRRDNR